MHIKNAFCKNTTTHSTLENLLLRFWKNAIEYKIVVKAIYLIVYLIEKKKGSLAKERR